MLSKSLMIVLRLSRRLGVRVVLLTVLAMLATLLAPMLDPVMPDSLKSRFNRNSVLPILNILATSMLAATTFSLGVMVSAFQAASGQATPRAYRILMSDGTTQMVLATFVSTFLFSLTAIVMFRAGFYSEASAVAIFALTVISIALVIIAILRWIDHLSQLGSMDYTLRMVEDAAGKALRNAAAAPCLGAQALDPTVAPPSGAAAVRAQRSGYVQFIDMPGLHDALDQCDATLWVTAPPGCYVLRGAPLAYASGASPAFMDGADSYFTLGRSRTLEQDARHGLMVLSEIAARALSPGINDPGTAIDVIHRLQRLLWEHAPDDRSEQREILYPRAHVPRITAADLLGDAFDVIIRDGAGRVEVTRQILHALHRLENSGWPELEQAAHDTRHYAGAHAQSALAIQADRDSVAALAAVEQEGQ